MPQRFNSSPHRILSINAQIRASVTSCETATAEAVNLAITMVATADRAEEAHEDGVCVVTPIG